MSPFERRAGGSSYLVRVWREPGEGASPEEPARFYVRNLRSGEERYLKGPEHLADFFRQEPGERRAASGSPTARRRAG